MVNHAAPPKKMWQQNETNMETNTSKIVTIVLKLNDIEFIDDGSCSNYVQLIKSKVRRPKNSEGLQFFFSVPFTLLSDERQGNEPCSRQSLGGLVQNPRLVVSKWEGSLIF